jgi:acetyl-CoA carboxylase biotin carboxylase subunit
MIGKLIVSAFSREEVIDKMSRALDELIIEGIHTTVPFHKALMRNERFRRGDYTTKFMLEWDWLGDMQRMRG